jgi:hypothetical protein
VPGIHYRRLHLPWVAGAPGIMRRTCERHVDRTGITTRTVLHGATNLSARETRAAVLERLWCGHWTMERASMTCVT